jgi:hypothetical protein
MQIPVKSLLTLTTATALLLMAFFPNLNADDKDLVPPQLSKEQKDNLQRFLQKHEKPDRFLPPNAKVIGPPLAGADTSKEKPSPKPIRQYLVQIASHRPVPGEEEPKRVDVYYYRPNPEKGKPGIAVRHTVDLTTGDQVGSTEVLTNSHVPISREELTEAVALAREKSPAVQELYKERDPKAVRWEYLQLLINRKHDMNEPGDRAIRLVFTANPSEDQPAPAPVRVIVNLTKGVVVPDAR